jgi:hypothetical protein
MLAVPLISEANFRYLMSQQPPDMQSVNILIQAAIRGLMQPYSRSSLLGNTATKSVSSKSRNKQYPGTYVMNICVASQNGKLMMHN